MSLLQPGSNTNKYNNNNNTIHYRRNKNNLYCTQRSTLEWNLSLWGAGSRRTGRDGYTLWMVREIKCAISQCLKVPQVLYSLIAAGDSFPMVGALEQKNWRNVYWNSYCRKEYIKRFWSAYDTWAKTLGVKGQIIYLYFRVKHPVDARYQKTQNSVTYVIGVGDRRLAVR